jgi:predicted acyl esterase
MGPWFHSQVNQGRLQSGPRWKATLLRIPSRDVLKPFFDQYLEPVRPKRITPSCPDLQHRGKPLGPAAKLAPCHMIVRRSAKTALLTGRFRLGFEKPAASRDAADSYCVRSRQACAVSAPSRADSPTATVGEGLMGWFRSAHCKADRTDVLVYQSPVLTAPSALRARRSRICSPRPRQRF